MPFANGQRCQLYYERHGTGPALLFLHGAGSNAATWWQQLPAFAAEHTCITTDIRCFGRSDAATSDFVLQTLVDDALSVLDTEGVSSCTVVGQSLGGMIGLRLALQHPQRIRGLVACDSSLAVDHPALVASIESRFEKVPAVAIEQRSLGEWFVRTHPAHAELYAQINHFNPSAFRISREDWRRTLLSLNHPSQLVAVSALAHLTCPVLFLVGREDPIVPVNVMFELAGVVPNAEVVVIEQAAHSAYFEKPDEFNRCVRDFMHRRVHSPAVNP